MPRQQSSSGKTTPGKTSRTGGGGRGNKTKSSNAKASKHKYEPVKPGKFSPGTMIVVPPKPVKSPSDQSTTNGHMFGYFRMGLEKRK